MIYKIVSLDLRQSINIQFLIASISFLNILNIFWIGNIKPFSIESADSWDVYLPLTNFNVAHFPLNIAILPTYNTFIDHFIGLFRRASPWKMDLRFFFTKDQRRNETDFWI